MTQPTPRLSGRSSSRAAECATYQGIVTKEGMLPVARRRLRKNGTDMRGVTIAGGLGITVRHRGQMTRQRQVAAGKVGRIVVRQRANDGQLIAVLRKLLKVLAEENSRRVGGDGREFAAHFLGRVGLGIEGIDLTRSAPGKQKDTPFCLSGPLLLLARLHTSPSPPDHPSPSKPKVPALTKLRRVNSGFRGYAPGQVLITGSIQAKRAETADNVSRIDYP